MTPHQLTWAAATTPEHRAEDGNLVVLSEWVGDDLLFTVLRTEPGGYLSGQRRLSLASAHEVIELYRASTESTAAIARRWLAEQQRILDTGWKVTP